MMREARHGIAFGACTVVSVSQSDAQHLRGSDGIVAIGLIKVTATKQQECLRVLCLEVEKLFHHRCEFLFFLCHRRQSFIVFILVL